jgi:hypothetical protein
MWCAIVGRATAASYTLLECSLDESLGARVTNRLLA